MARKKGKAAATMTDSQKNLDANLPVFQLKITLKDIRPPVWRRIQTHDCSLAELHEIIQFCMPWDDEHLYAFEIGKEQYSALDRGAALPKCRDSNSLRLSDLVGRKTYHFVYEYDFGDSWRHVIEIEETLPPEERVRYPRCLDGRRACPPEDCGGPWGYPNFLDAIQDPDHPDNEERLEWIGDEFDPERFDLDEMNGGLGRLRRWLGQRPPRRAPKAAFTESAPRAGQTRGGSSAISRSSLRRMGRHRGADCLVRSHQLRIRWRRKRWRPPIRSMRNAAAATTRTRASTGSTRRRSNWIRPRSRRRWNSPRSWRLGRCRRAMRTTGSAWCSD